MKSVTIAHLSDLHLSQKNLDAFDRWEYARKQVLTEAIDFIVISGDLADRATADDYALVRQFLGEVCLAVKDQDPGRVVIVPGNHDVDWNASLGRRLAFKEIRAKRKDLEQVLRNGPRRGARFRHRFHLSLLARPEVWEVDERLYGRRFERFSALLTEFYGASRSAPPKRVFDPSTPDASAHWSAHLFPGDQIAFYGLSSCVHNDRLSREAALNPQAIKKVTRHMDDHARGMRRIAVWHHGLLSERGSPDLLTLDEMSILGHAGFEVGLHGHTHRDEQNHLEARFEELLVLGTGSFAAEKSERQGGVRNQFSIIEAAAASIVRTIYEYDETKHEWKGTTPRPHPRSTARTTARPASGNTIGYHKRTIRVLPKGIAVVTAELRDVMLNKTMTIGSPSPGFSGIDFDTQAKAVGPSATHLEVNVERAEGGPHRFIAVAPRREHIERMTWQYRFANGFALDEVDAVTGTYPGRMALGLEPSKGSMDGFAYCVEDPTSMLELELRLPKGSGILSPQIVVERARPSTSEVRWERDDYKNDQVTLPTVTKTRVAIRVGSPRVDTRYGLRYRLARRRASWNETECMSRAVDACRSVREPSVATLLTNEISTALRKAFSLERDIDFWIGHLWDPRSQKLLACFGKFAPEHWASTFSMGEGIAGHTLRTGEPTVYQYVPPPTQRHGLGYLLYCERKRESERAPHSWVIELPIFQDGQRAIGTVGFAARVGENASLKGLHRLETIASQMFGEPAKRAGHKNLLTKAIVRISAAFWRTWGREDESAQDIYDAEWASGRTRRRARS